MYKDPKWFDAQKTHKAVRAGGMGHGLYLPLCKLALSPFLPIEASSGMWKGEDKVKRVWKDVDCELCQKINDPKVERDEVLAIVKKTMPVKKFNAIMDLE